MISSGVVVVGFIPLLDCAPLVAAVEKGFANDEGIDLTLVRETSWANIRDRVVVGHFDAAHMLGPMTLASTLGIGHLQVPMVAPLSLGLGGNAITVSLPLWQQMERAGAAGGADPLVQGNALRHVVADRQLSRRPPLTFAMVYPFSCHNYELRYWLSAVGIDPDRDVRLVVLPPPLLVDALREGQIDGFCVGEPWSSLAVSVGVGSIVTPTTAIWHLSPEKVLGCRREWAGRFPERTAALVRAIHRAAEWCEQPSHHEELAHLLSEPKYVGAPAHILLRGLSGSLTLAPGSEARHIENFYVPSRHAATFPWVSHALWFYSQMVRWGQAEFSDRDVEAVRATYRPDLYRAALAPLDVNLPHDDFRAEASPDGFFDGRPFDPARLREYAASP
ncbi:MAG TPA: CmpA/NrtA family ABC transporter substrate-binding protein [Povalibacter sp.]|uniref:CmpA/NrtA family ABC transporter substrate-binding protein n=1 Tax=Povalibacter sp. TaxID=1962978 RepID=UPI002C161213|nr:CmpA/NrtA family ABC transporter substrate-binding protein [Povalibacter sp.]HMN46988.1 CmpA/NrtA family ABC transporter substrate-binding protein [Povalibacter sp.]